MTEVNGMAPMSEADKLREFQAHRPHLRAVAYRTLGSLSAVDDALQETWLRFDRADTGSVDNIGGWLTTVTARVCLNMLDKRGRRPEVSLDGGLPDPVLQRESDTDPERDALIADSVGLGLMIVLETLRPPERVAFVLHDLFRVPFTEIAALLGRTEPATRQLARRARRRVAEADPVPDPDRAQQRRVVDAFFSAARAGDLDGLLEVLAPEATLFSDGGPGNRAGVEGAERIAHGAMMFADPHAEVRPVLVNGGPGVVVVRDGVATAVMAFTVVDNRVLRIDALNDMSRLSEFDIDEAV